MSNGLKVAAIFFSVAVVGSPMATFARDMTTGARPALSDLEGLRLAQNSNCDEARKNANTCRTNWNNIGGGTSGQAGAFYQCWKNYCVLLQSHACNTPSYCSQ